MIDQIIGKIIELMSINSAVMFAILFVFIIIAYKVFRIAMKAMIFGALGASIPVIAFFTGISLPPMFAEMSILSKIIWFGVFGVGAFFVYFFATHSLKTIKFVLSPFGRMFKDKPKVIEKTVIVKAKDED